MASSTPVSLLVIVAAAVRLGVFAFPTCISLTPAAVRSTRAHSEGHSALAPTRARRFWQHP